MNRYLCKCGRAVNKSTNADNTGNRETEGCEGCPYLMPWGPTEWDHTRHAMVTDVKGYECRMSPTLEYRTELRGHLDDKTTIRITSLDFDFLECVSDWVKEHYPNGELSGGFSRDRIRPAEYVDEGRYRYTLACSQNKKGIAAKRALWAEFFDETFHRKDMDADAEKQKILRDIEKGKAAAHKDAVATNKETNTMLIYRDPATGWLYRVSPQPGQDDCFCIEYLDPASSAAWKFWPAEAKTRATSRKTIVEVFEARAKQNGWELVSDTNGCAPGLPEICRGCLCWKCGNVDCDLICDHNDREVHECGNFGSIGMGESCEYYIPKKEEYEPCQNQPAPNGDAAATTAGSAVPEPAETSTTPTDANTLPAPGCPADAGSATQSLSAAGPASLEAEPEATPFDYSGLDAQTVADLHLAEREYLGGRKLAEMGLRRMADGVAIAHDALCGGCDNLSQAHNNQYSKDTFGAWCGSIGIHRKAAERLLQVSKLLDNSTPREQKVLEELTPSVLYEASRPSAEPEAVEALKSKQVKTLKEFRALEAQIKAEREAREKAVAEVESLRYANDALRDEAATARAQAKHAQEKADALETRPVMSELFDAKERIKELEARPVEVAVQEPDPAEVERRAAARAETMTAQLRGELKTAQHNIRQMQDRTQSLLDQLEDARNASASRQLPSPDEAFETAFPMAKDFAGGIRTYHKTFLMVAPGLAPVDLKTCAQLMIDAAQELIAGLRAVMTLPEPVEGDEDFD